MLSIVDCYYQVKIISQKSCCVLRRLSLMDDAEREEAEIGSDAADTSYTLVKHNLVTPFTQHFTCIVLNNTNDESL